MPKFLQRTIRLKTLLFISLTVLVVLLVAGYWLRAELQQQLRACYIGNIEVAGERYVWLLPEVDRVVIYAIERDSEETVAEHRGLPRWKDSTYVILKEVTLEGEKAKGLVDNWRSLQPNWASAGMCHEPAHALRFYNQGQLILETEFCWKCANFTLPATLGKMTTGFNRETKHAKSFWKTLQEELPPKQASATDGLDSNSVAKP